MKRIPIGVCILIGLSASAQAKRPPRLPILFNRSVQQIQTPSTAIIPANRITTWNPGLQALGGIPNRTTICTTINPTGSGDDATIQNAVNTCADNTVVQLGAGTFGFTGLNVTFSRSNVTVRGSVDGNGNLTSIISMATSHDGPAFTFGSGGQDQSFLVQPQSLTVNALKGTSSVTVASNPGYVVGELVTIDQLFDPNADTQNVVSNSTTGIWLNPDHFNSPFYTQGAAPATPSNRIMFCRQNRVLTQTVEITNINGTTITFSTPLHMDFLTSLTAQVVRHSNGQGGAVTAPVKLSGVENVYIQGGRYGGHIYFSGASSCWAKNTESYWWQTSGISFTRSFRCEYRDSYIHQTQNPNPGGGGYAIDLNWAASDNLLENNIVWAANKVMVMRASGGGNVTGYNYMEDGFGAGYLTIPESGINASHFAGPHYELFEGNQSWNAAADNVWGNSLYITFFRNNLTGLRRNVSSTPYTDSSGTLYPTNNFNNDSAGRAMVQLGATHDYYNYVGNVLGYSGMPSPGSAWGYESKTMVATYPSLWVIGTSVAGDVDASQAQADATYARTLRQGNYDYSTNASHWHGIGGVDGSSTPQTIPSSLYLSAKPAFFGSNPWPWVTPENAPSTLATLPARARFDIKH
jgi:hypothetical protein